jgi:SAM-dependent methyltransferase
VEVEVGDYEQFSDTGVAPLQPHQDTAGVGSLPERISPELYSYLPRSENNDEWILDLGCGSDTLQSAVERKGYEWMGVDITGEKALLLGDAHALPFQDNTFEGTISLRVIEHLQHPLIALSEIERVTKPDGVFLGNVAFLEPYHGNSYLHHSVTGISSHLKTAGFSVDQLGSRGHGFLHIGVRLYPLLPHTLGNLLLLVPYLLHRLWYLVGDRLVHDEKTTEEFRRNRFAKGIEFVAKIDGE